MKASDNAYPSVLLVDTVAPADPPAGKLRLFVEGGALKLVDETGAVVGVGEVSAADFDTLQGEVDALETGKANTSHTQPSSTITDFTEAVQDVLGAALVGSGVSVTYNDAAGTVTITGVGSTDMEAVRDAIGIAIVGVGAVQVTVDDAADTITIATTATDRSTHTGTQLSSTISDLTEFTQDTVANQVTAGTGLSKTYDDATGLLTLASTASGGLDLEAVQDAVAAMVVAGTNVTKSYDDTAGTLTLSASGSGGGSGGGFIGPWNVGTSYPAGSIVTYGGKSWGCAAAVAAGGLAPAPTGVVTLVPDMADNIASANAISIATTGVIAYSNPVNNSAFSAETGEPPFTTSPWARTGWLKYIPATSGTVTFDTIGSTSDSTMRLYQLGGTPPLDFADLTLIGADDDSAGGNQARITAALTGGATYYIQLGTYNSGTWILNLTNARATDPVPLAWTELEEIESFQDRVAAMIVAGTNVTKTYDDTAGTLTLTASGGSGGGGGGGTSLFRGTWAAQAVVDTNTLVDAAAVTEMSAVTSGSNYSYPPTPAGVGAPGQATVLRLGVPNAASLPSAPTLTWTIPAGVNRMRMQLKTGPVGFGTSYGIYTVNSVIAATWAPNTDWVTVEYAVTPGATVTLTVNQDFNYWATLYVAQIQYLGPSSDPYMVGQYVIHAGKTWVSLSDNNSGTPGVAGWAEVITAVRKDYVFTDQRNPLTTGVGAQKVPNNTGRVQTILAVRADMAVAPTGNPIKIDVNKNGVSIFPNPANRPTVPDGALFGTASAIGNPTWSPGEVLTVDLDEIGTTIPGGGLTLTILSEG